MTHSLIRSLKKACRVKTYMVFCSVPTRTWMGEEERESGGSVRSINVSEWETATERSAVRRRVV